MIRAALAAGLIVLAAAPTHAEDRDVATLLAAYREAPSAPLLLDLGAALRDSGRLADAANTYQRYLLDPTADPARAEEVKAKLAELDAQLTILTIYVMPRDTELSIDGGPFVAVGGSLTTRVRAGEHAIRARFHEATGTLAVIGVAGQTKEVSATLHVTVPPDVAGTAPEHVDGWLIAGDPRPIAPERRTETVEVAAPVIASAAGTPTTISGVAAVRIDGKLRGFAGGLGFAVAHGALEAEIMVLRSDSTGGYLGGRYRMVRPTFRPYAALGIPAFVFDANDAMGATNTKLAVGLRVGAGAELRINRHLAVLFELGYEHFFNVGGTGFEPDVFVPTIAAMGSL